MWLVTYFIPDVEDALGTVYATYSAVLTDETKDIMGDPEQSYVLHWPENVVRRAEGGTCVRVSPKMSIFRPESTTFVVEDITAVKIDECEYDASNRVFKGDTVTTVDRYVIHLEGSRTNNEVVIYYETDGELYREPIMYTKTLEECMMGLDNWKQQTPYRWSLEITEDKFVQDGRSLFHRATGKHIHTLTESGNFLTLTIDQESVYPLLREVQ